jgi:hypothetical protein
MTARNERGGSIRPATSVDADVISEILVAAGRAAWGAFLGEARVEASNRGKLHSADLVAVDGEGVFAIVAWNARTGEIERLFTHPRGLEQAWLLTEERNVGARRFYEAVGWREEGPAQVRDWHGVRLREPRYVRDL